MFCWTLSNKILCSRKTFIFFCTVAKNIFSKLRHDNFSDKKHSLRINVVKKNWKFLKACIKIAENLGRLIVVVREKFSYEFPRKIKAIHHAERSTLCFLFFVIKFKFNFFAKEFKFGSSLGMDSKFCFVFLLYFLCIVCRNDVWVENICK